MAMISKHECDAIKSDGTIVHAEPGVGCTLAVATYYFVVSTPDSVVSSVHLTWSTALVATSINFQDCNLPRYKGLQQADPDGGTDVSDFDSTSGNWITEDPSTAYVPIIGTGATVTNMTIALAGGSAGGAMLNLGNLGTRRGRIKIVVTTAGVLRVCPWGKSGS